MLKNKEDKGCCFYLHKTGIILIYIIVIVLTITFASVYCRGEVDKIIAACIIGVLSFYSIYATGKENSRLIVIAMWLWLLIMIAGIICIFTLSYSIAIPIAALFVAACTKSYHYIIDIREKKIIQIISIPPNQLSAFNTQPTVNVNGNHINQVNPDQTQQPQQPQQPQLPPFHYDFMQQVQFQQLPQYNNSNIYQQSRFQIPTHQVLLVQSPLQQDVLQQNFNPNLNQSASIDPNFDPPPAYPSHEYKRY